MKIIFFCVASFLFYSTGFGQSGLASASGGDNFSPNLVEKNELLSDSNSETCNLLIKAVYVYKDSQQYEEAYYEFRHYIESCAYLPQAYTTFLDVGSMNSSSSQDKHRFEEYRDWLKKVLYYNLDTNYYCADVTELFSTFSWFNDARGHDIRGSLALAFYLIDSGKCVNLRQFLLNNIPATWEQLYSVWGDTVQNPGQAVFDSTLPTLDELGLGILRGKPAEVRHFNEMMLGALVSGLYSTPNPFTSETKISFSCREAVLMKFEVFDVLGEKVYQGDEHVYDKGENVIILPGKDLPYGILYGRFILPDGSANTIKLRKIE
ncbi:MAG TPA: hypothetical protein VFO76_02390 [Candidatus Kapabacteria bacterium]|nr:hypothetical protein [Candidatus Kapabacteria bacterium]